MVRGTIHLVMNCNVLYLETQYRSLRRNQCLYPDPGPISLVDDNDIDLFTNLHLVNEKQDTISY